MTTNMKNILLRPAYPGAFVAFAFLLIAPDTVQAQTPPKQFFTCYVPSSGVIYRIKEPGLKNACTGKKHVEFSWAEPFAATDGKVGIGTTTPTVALDVVGDIHASGKLIIGNTITIDNATNSISTSPAQVLELHPGGERALRLEPNATSPNLIGGFSGNSVAGGVSGGTIGGGGQSGVANRVEDNFGTVGGGSSNEAGLGGGQMHATVGGGFDNAASGEEATVSGGSFNTASGPNATVGGGLNNTAGGDRASVGGGSGNMASNLNATVGGGSGNTASATDATVPGGSLNVAAGDASFAAGTQAKANHNGTFVWADQTTGDFASTAPDQFLIRASGGVGIGTTSPSTALEVNGTIKATAFDIGYEIVIGPRGTVTSGFSPVLTATCPSGKRVLGGGADIDFVSGAVPLIMESRPTGGGTGWVASVRKLFPAQTDFDAFAVAICARV